VKTVGQLLDGFALIGDPPNLGIEILYGANSILELPLPVIPIALIAPLAFID